VGTLQCRLAQTASLQTGALQIGLTQVGSVEVGVLQLRALQDRLAEVGALQVGIRQKSPGGGALPGLALRLEPFAMLASNSSSSATVTGLGGGRLS